MDAPKLCHLLVKHETEAFNRAHCAKEQLHGNCGIKASYTDFHSAGLFSFKTHHSQTHELCLIKLGNYISQSTQDSSNPSSNYPSTIINSGHFQSQKCPSLVDKL